MWSKRDYEAIKEYTIAATILTIIIGFGLLAVSIAEPTPEVEEYVRAILGEAEDQGEIGMLAVACGIRNRPEGLVGVMGFKSDRYRKTTQHYRDMARVAWYRAQYPPECAFIQGADSWCSDLEVCREAWAEVPMVYITKIKDHHFFRRITTNE